MSAATPPQKDHDIALPSCSKSVVNSDSLNNNQNCIIAQAPTITGPLLVTNNFFVGRDPSMISDQIVEEKSFGTDPAGYGEKGTNRTVGSSVETIEESEVPHAKCRIPKYLSRLPVNRENHLETREDSLRECNSISSTHTRRRLINVVPETRESIKLPIDFDESDSDAIQNYMRSNFFYRPAVIPLWTPSPIGANRQEILKKFNVCVGDVGYFTDTGGFHVLFNVFLPASANIALGFTPPDAFEPYGPVYCSDEVSDIRSIPRTNYRHCHGDFSEKDSGLPQNPQRLVRPFNLPGYFYRKCIASYHMEASKSKKKVREGSILDLPHGAWKDTLNVGTRLKLRIYLEDHGNDWYNHYLKQPTGPIIPEDSLKVVTGSYKCIGWALATCSTKSSKTISAGLYKTSETCPYYDWDRHDEVVVQTGPLAEETQGDKEFPPNQCVAVQVYSVTIAKTVRNATESFFESVKSSFTRGNTPNNSRVRLSIRFLPKRHT